MVKIRNIGQRLNNFKNELVIVKRRIKDNSLLEIQKKINKMKEIIDAEINRRMESVNKDSNLRGNQK